MNLANLIVRTDGLSRHGAAKPAHATIWLAGLLVALAACPPARAESALATEPVPAAEAWSAHGQFTFVEQYHPRFNSPYAGANSLGGAASAKQTADLTAFLGARLWQGAELYLNPEVDQGFGLGDTLGVAGFPSAEAYKVGRQDPYLKLNRLFVRQVIALGSATEAVEADANALAGPRPVDRLTLTVGKFSVVDLFDNNAYAHDPRGDFLNWTIVDAGAFDYAADAWGYTLGAAADWTQGRWTLRGGWFALSESPNGAVPDLTAKQYALVAELEHRHDWLGQSGALRLLAFVNHGQMGRYIDALGAAAPGTAPDVAPVRRTASRAGVAVNLEQQISTALGGFVRASANDGRYETYEFTDVNRSFSAGLTLRGSGWRRNDDRVGIAAAVNAVSSEAQRYFAAGGLGLLIGDGTLAHYAVEQILEAFYAARLVDGVILSADLQRIQHPAYNADRGPVTALGLRLHAEF